ncbi:MAG: D-glycero-beta-D-manno-heptose 1,7-bisphosphate 7-phosphatase [Acidobacteria bacterium]|nr:D-glycero-beta-D-manno-heptose 1,7-bisphosphate 7-phosphatase [Acidobacteriota bacterium]
MTSQTNNTKAASQTDNTKAASRKPQGAIFLDRDGTINEDIGYAAHPDELVIYPYAAEAIRRINEAGWKVIVITNQSGIARGLLDEAMLDKIHERLQAELAKDGAHLDAIYYCPHHPRIGDERFRQVCACRKPQIGMLERAAHEHGIDLATSLVIGDKASDINLASNAGAQGVLVRTGYGNETLAHIERWPCYPSLVAENLLDAVTRILAGGKPS